ncbi:CLUMA_CG000559, isoform A [Clunio marinus]|uniref:CLUMA_CG000559, isoform A n=1 Tax=Clunio marinus TaxID=568069 RepID=A0A1J1HJT1_9DIPT|nr:CLUMA_CG000559, isoform A [Clunio marinus]
MKLHSPQISSSSFNTPSVAFTSRGRLNEINLVAFRIGFAGLSFMHGWKDFYSSTERKHRKKTKWKAINIFLTVYQTFSSIQII